MITMFLLEGIFSNYIVIDFILFYFYFHNPKYSFWVGLCYDIIYTGTFLLHAFLFTVVSFIISKIKEKNLYYFILVLIGYHVMEYAVLLLMNLHVFTYQDILHLFRIIVSNSILLFILDWIHKKKKPA